MGLEAIVSVSTHVRAVMGRQTCSEQISVGAGVFLGIRIVRMLKHAVVVFVIAVVGVRSSVVASVVLLEIMLFPAIANGIGLNVISSRLLRLLLLKHFSEVVILLCLFLRLSLRLRRLLLLWGHFAWLWLLGLLRGSDWALSEWI